MENDDRRCGSWRPHDRDGHGIEEEEEEEIERIVFDWRIVDDKMSGRSDIIEE